MAFTQGDAIRDFVFPLVALETSSSEIRFSSLLGTGFLIGDRGFALTAAHVLPVADRPMAALFAGSGGWEVRAIQKAEKHPLEDVAVVQLSGGPWKSFLRLGEESEYASMKYMLWGYPTDVLFEVIQNGVASQRPDLIYSEGHVRRRLGEPRFPKLSGSVLFELSQPAGRGCSGSPVVKLPKSPGDWPVVALYIGERRSEDVHLGYAAPAEAFREWQPRIVGRSVLVESQQTSPV